MVLDAVEFIRRYLLHVLPKGLMRIRHYGLLANRCRRKNLERIRQALETTAEALPTTKTENRLANRTTDTGYVCPKCRKGRLRLIASTQQPRLFEG